MKKAFPFITRVLPALLVLAVLVCAAVSCESQKSDADNLWKDAVYNADTELGTGAKTIRLTVTAQDKSVTLTVHTDKETVGDALLEQHLIDGEQGPYGLYVKVVNGMTADYDVDRYYWSFCIDGQMAMTGVDTTPVTDGAVYSFEYAK